MKIAFIFLASIFSSTSLQAGELCQGKNKTLGCLQSHYQELLKNDETLFYEILKTSEFKATSCKSSADSIAFLKTTAQIGGGAATAEFFSEAIEHWAQKKPRCLLDSILKLPSAARGRTIEFLRNPTFVDKDDLEEAFSKLESDQKYKSLLREIDKQAP